MRKFNWKIVLISILIVFITQVVIVSIKPSIHGISDNVWDAFGLSFGIAYILTYMDRDKEGNKVSWKTRVLTYIIGWVAIFGIYVGLNYLW